MAAAATLQRRLHALRTALPGHTSRAAWSRMAEAWLDDCQRLLLDRAATADQHAAGEEAAAFLRYELQILCRELRHCEVELQAASRLAASHDTSRRVLLEEVRDLREALSGRRLQRYVDMAATRDEALASLASRDVRLHELQQTVVELSEQLKRQRRALRLGHTLAMEAVRVAGEEHHVAAAEIERNHVNELAEVQMEVQMARRDAEMAREQV
eukprot:6198146-Pleurochrysis_carterae.AAC.5